MRPVYAPQAALLLAVIMRRRVPARQGESDAIFVAKRRSI
jgi:hypothetical protein